MSVLSTLFFRDKLHKGTLFILNSISVHRASNAFTEINNVSLETSQRGDGVG